MKGPRKSLYIQPIRNKTWGRSACFILTVSVFLILILFS
jgi:hypothetical protein